MGTNALPFLLKQALSTDQDSALRRKLNRLSRPFPRWCPRFWSYGMVRWEAFWAIFEIKPPASLVMPQLEKAFARTNTPARWGAIYLLGCLGDGGEKGVPMLLQALNETNLPSQIVALQSLGFLGPKASAAVPRLTELLQTEASRSNHLHGSIAHTLGAIGSNAAPALPRIKELFHAETDRKGRTAMAVALCQIDARQDEALAFLIDPLKDPSNAKQQQFAAMDLGRVGPNASAAVPALLEAMGSPRVEVSMAAVDALKKIGVSNEVLLPRLEENLKSNDETIRVNSAARILSIEPGNPGAQQALLRVVQGGSIFASFAVETLGKAGAPAQAVVPALRQMLSTQPKEVRENTLRAIRRIELDAPQS
jgi:HEAT repeat protein